MSHTITIGLIQSCSETDRERALQAIECQIREAAGKGAQIICTQELFATPYFCQTQDTANFEFAEPIPGPTCGRLAALAKSLQVVIIASLFERREAGIYHNTAVVFDADGSLLGRYRKMHIPQDPSFEEKFYFTPGDTGFKSWDTRFGKIAVLICWDQWFPEAARLAALSGAKILFYPTAIGWLHSEKSALGKQQHLAWETVQRGHAVANGSYLAAVNRVGIEGDIEFWGQSFVSDCYGQLIAKASVDKPEVLVQELDMSLIEAFRNTWPFFRDRRIDAYSGLTERALEGSD